MMDFSSSGKFIVWNVQINNDTKMIMIMIMIMIRNKISARFELYVASLLVSHSARSYNSG